MSDLADNAQADIDASLQAALAVQLRSAQAEAGRTDGTGICSDCDEPIAQARLAALPHAYRCIDCQRLAEGA